MALSPVTRCWLWWMAAIAVVTVAGPSAAAVKLCLRVTDSTSRTDGLERLARTEVARHPSHTLVTSGCVSRLVVELFRTGSTKYLSVGLEGAVPTRSPVKQDSDLADTLTEGVALALGNDPEHLVANPDQWAERDRLGPSVLIHGNNIYRVELVEIVARTDHHAAMAPGFALGFSRGSGHWQAFGRTYAASATGPVAGNDRALRVAAGLDVGLTYELFTRTMTSPYASVGAGVGYLRFEGRTDPAQADSEDYADKLGALAHVRVGVRTLRLYDFDAEVFVAGYLPLFKTRRIDSELFGEKGAYTPFVQLGVGAGF